MSKDDEPGKLGTISENAYYPKEGEVMIVISPSLDENGEWDGELRTGWMVGATKAVAESEAVRNAIDLSLTMLAVTNVLDEDPELFEYFVSARSEVMKEMFPAQYAEMELANSKDYSIDGNVIKLTRWTKTLGEA